MAILLLLITAGLFRFVRALETLLHLANRPQILLLALVTDLPRLLFAVLRIAVLLRLLGSSLHFQFADLLRLEVTILFLHREWEDIGEFLAISMDICLADFHLNLSRNVIASLRWFPGTNHTFLAHIHHSLYFCPSCS